SLMLSTVRCLCAPSYISYCTFPHSRRSTRFPYTTLFRSLVEGFENILAVLDCRRDAWRERGVAQARTLYIGEHARQVDWPGHFIDRKSTRLNSSHVKISYAVFCLIKKIQTADEHCHDIII